MSFHDDECSDHVPISASKVTKLSRSVTLTISTTGLTAV